VAGRGLEQEVLGGTEGGGGRGGVAILFLTAHSNFTSPKISARRAWFNGAQQGGKKRERNDLWPFTPPATPRPPPSPPPLLEMSDSRVPFDVVGNQPPAALAALHKAGGMLRTTSGPCLKTELGTGVTSCMSAPPSPSPPSPPPPPTQRVCMSRTPAGRSCSDRRETLLQWPLRRFIALSEVVS